MLAEFTEEKMWHEKKGSVLGGTGEESNKTKEMVHYRKKKLNQLLMNVTVAHDI